ncbi:MAG: ribosome maturation factor RimM [Candidatus Binataceae bacterium]|jgi:16S rRNA processing protein RimM
MTTVTPPAASDGIAEPCHSRKLLKIGRVAGIHGLAGALRLKLDNPDSSVLATADEIFIARDRIAPSAYRIRAVSALNNGAVKLALEGLCDPDAASALKGASVLIDAVLLPAKQPDEFYYHEAVGCAVRTTGGRELGVIEEVFATGANDVWVVRGGGAEVLVPVIADVVKSMDFRARKIVIEAVPGLLD